MERYEHEREHDPFSPHVQVAAEVESPAGPDPSGPGGPDDPPVDDPAVVDVAPPPERARTRARRRRETQRRPDPALAAELAELEPPRASDDE